MQSSFSSLDHAHARRLSPRGPRLILLLLPLTLALSLGLLAGSRLGLFPGAPVSAAGTPGLRLLESSLDRIVVELDTPDYALSTLNEGGVSFQKLRVPGLGETGERGAPSLPFTAPLLAIPPGASYSIAVEGQPQPLPGSWSIAPVPVPSLQYGPAGSFTGQSGLQLLPSPDLYNQDALYPAAPARVASDEYLRSQRVLRLELAPFQYNPAAHTLLHRPALRVTLSLTYPGGRTPAALGAHLQEPEYEEMLRGQILNAASAANWRARPVPTAPTPSTPPGAGPWFKLSLNTDGLYFVPCAALQSAGVDVSSPASYKLFKNNSELAINVLQPGPACGPSDGVEFYGLATTSPYTTTNVYWLTTSGAPGQRMAVKPDSGSLNPPAPFVAVPHFEQNLLYRSFVPAYDFADHWFWDYISGGVTITYPITLTNVAAVATTSPLTVSLHAFTTGTHRTQVSINGTLVADRSWFGQSPLTITVPVTQSLFVNGTNTLSVSELGSVLDGIFSNSFDVGYAHTFTADNDRLVFGGDQPGAWLYQAGGYSNNALEGFDITDLTHPALLTNASGTANTFQFADSSATPRRYLVQTTARRLAPLSITPYTLANLSSVANGADYILITRADLLPTVGPLAARRAASGLRVKLVNAQDIYDEFNDGVLSPLAIQSFLSYAYSHWQPPAPAYVLLVGDGTYDFKNYLGFNADTVIPPYLAFVDLFEGEVDADNRLVVFTPGSRLPQMMLGRLPARTPPEAAVMVNKILGYPTASAGPWQRNVVLVSDNTPDAAGDFQGQSEDIANNYLPPPYTATRLYMNTICGPKQVNPIPCPAMNTAIVNAFNAGAVALQWIGHGSFTFWADENVYGVNDLPSLANAAHLPVTLPWDCFSGNFVNPDPALQGLSESEVRLPSGGSIASFAPTGADVDSGHHYMNIGFFNTAFGAPSAALGAAAQNAKLYLYTNSSGNYLELLDTYLLLGDPALRFPSLTHPIYLPVLGFGSAAP